MNKMSFSYRFSFLSNFIRDNFILNGPLAYFTNTPYPEHNEATYKVAESLYYSNHPGVGIFHITYRFLIGASRL